MSDYAVLGLLAILGPVLLFGLVAQIALWIDKPLPHDAAYARRQKEDRALAGRRRQSQARLKARRIV